MLVVQKIILIILLFISAAAISCNSSRTSKNEAGKENLKNEKPNPPVPLPPGQADVDAVIKDYSESNADIIATISINEVLRYGASTPPLAQGSEVKLLISKQLNDNKKDIFKKGEELLIRISFNRGMNNKRLWKLVSFINK